MAIIPNPKKQEWIGMVKGSFNGDIFEAWNIDLEKNKGRLMLSDRVIIKVDSNDVSSFDVPLAFTLVNVDGLRTWCLCDNMILKTKTGSSFSYDFIKDTYANSPTGGSDMLSYRSVADADRILVAQGNDFTNYAYIAMLDTTGAVGSGWNATWKNVTNQAFSLAKLSNLIIVGCGGSIATIDNNDIVVPNRLSFEPRYTCYLLYAASDVVWMGWASSYARQAYYPEGTLIGGYFFQKGAISYWDGGNEVMNETYFIDSAPLSGFVVNNNPYFILQNGQIVVYSSLGFVEVQAFPNLEEGIPLSFQSVQKNSCTVDGTLVYINITAPLYSKRMRSGIWVFDTVTKNLYPYAGIGQNKQITVSSFFFFNVSASQNSSATNVSIPVTTTLNGTFGVLFATNDISSSNTLICNSSSTSIARQGNSSHFLCADNNKSAAAGSVLITTAVSGSSNINAGAFWLVPAYGQNVAYNTSVSSGDFSGTPSAVTVSLTPSSGSNQVLLIAVMGGGTNSGSFYISALTVNGVAITNTTLFSTSNSAGRIYIFFLYNPPPGTLIISCTQGVVAASDLCVTAIVYNGVASTPDQDFGQQIGAGSGALFLTKDMNNRLLIGSNIYTAYGGTTKNVIATLTVAANARGYFVTPLIQTPDIEGYWYNMWLKYMKFYNPGNLIVGKWRVQPELLNQYFHPLQATITWVSLTTFTAVLPVGITIGNEVEIMNGDNSGCTFHIKSMSSPADGVTTITVTLDENASYLSSSTALARFDNWNKISGTDIIPSQSGQSSALQGGNSVTSQSPYVQFKIELRGYNMGIDQLSTDEKTQTSPNL